MKGFSIPKTSPLLYKELKLQYDLFKIREIISEIEEKCKEKFSTALHRLVGGNEFN